MDFYGTNGNSNKLIFYSNQGKQTKFFTLPQDCYYIKIYPGSTNTSNNLVEWTDISFIETVFGSDMNAQEDISNLNSIYVFDKIKDIASSVNEDGYAVFEGGKSYTLSIKCPYKTPFTVNVLAKTTGSNVNPEEDYSDPAL
jgi:hypothetical protein